MSEHLKQPAMQKLKEVVHFVCKEMALEPEKLGAVKLQKIVWYFDVKKYITTMHTFTGASFVKSEFGPYSYDVKNALNDLVNEGRVHQNSQDHFGYEKAKLIGIGSTDLSVFSDNEIRWLEEITKEICDNNTAASISEKTHGPIWRMASLGEPIPFQATAIRLLKPSKEALEDAQKELGLA
jgi:uncharacterized protein YwgA